MKVIIGLEIHVHLLTESKLFCSCSTNYENKKPNENTCPICLGFPGSKPKVNKKAIDFGITVARALNCEVVREIFFSRKSYFYPDMPKNFQISQYEIPLAKNGFLEVSNKKIRIRRVHLEEDPGKLLHVGGDITTAQYVLVDYNRSGIPLLEIVTEPDFESTKEVREFLSKLSSILEHLEVFDSSREASLRVDANISLEGGERVEIKNITGFANVQKALDYEILRQENLRRMGMKVERETRHFDAETKTTHTLRKKEFEEDYGYIFEPDLTKVEISEEWIKGIEERMPELPDKRVGRFVEEYNIPERDAKVIVYVDKALADFFEKCCKIFTKPKEIAKWTVKDLLKCLNYQGITIRESKVKPEGFVELLELIEKGKITERLGKEIIKEYVSTGKKPEQIIKEKKLIMIGKEEMEKTVREVLDENKKAVEDYKSGKEKALEFLVGCVLKKTEVRADPNEVKKLIKEFIKKY
ncbi:MAG: Asp-tRNA(Asn)/Glu-tRNA(Gln) amidotransferase subunit GatB [Candidatus Aenigmatarchaeota archaeon]